MPKNSDNVVIVADDAVDFSADEIVTDDVTETETIDFSTDDAVDFSADDDAVDAVMSPAEYAEKLTEIAANLLAEKSSDSSDTAAPKASAGEKLTALVTAFTSRDVSATVDAIVAMGTNGLKTFKGLVADSLVECQKGDDPDDWNLSGMREIGAFKGSVESEFANRAPSATREPADPTTGAVMSFVRSLINVEKANRDLLAAVKVANDMGVTDADLSTRFNAFVRSLSDVSWNDADDFTYASTELLDRIYGAARGGTRRAATSSTGSDNAKAFTTIQNGTGHGGYGSGKTYDHIAAVVDANGGKATLKQINKSHSDFYPASGKLPAPGAIRNAFMRGVKGYVMEKVSDGYVCRRES